MLSSNHSNAGAAAAVNYIEDVFSTYLYTGNGSTQTITNGIDLSTKGGLVWTKYRSGGNISTASHSLIDTLRGANNTLASNLSSAEQNFSDLLTSFSSTGYVLGADASSGRVNRTNALYASWTFRKQPKFFDVVTTTSQTFSHLLASVPGCVIWKRTDAAEDWNVVSRRADGSYVQLNLNLTDGAFASYANATAAGLSSTSVTLPSFSTGGTYVAYLFAHDAGGFGLTGTDNVISCGSFTTDGSGNATVTLGYEPQWAMVKTVNSAGTWWMMDTMRGWTANTGNNFQYLQAQSSSAEGAAGTTPVNATGFTVAGNNFNTSETYIYIAIRRGPMKVPTTGTSVFQPVTYTGNGTSQSVTTGITGDLTYIKYRTDAGASTFFTDRLRGLIN